MTLALNEYLEDYEERFHLNYRRANYTLDVESLKLVLLCGIMEDVMENINMLFGGDIYQLTYDYIKSVIKNYSRALRKKGRSSQSLVSSSPSTTSIKHEIGNVAHFFPTNGYYENQKKTRGS